MNCYFNASHRLPSRLPSRLPLLAYARQAAMVWIGLITIFTASSVWAQELDKIFPRTGSAATGKILEVTRNGVVMEVRSVKENFPANTIQKIVYEAEPPQLSRAKDMAISEQWDDALESLNKVEKNSFVRKEVEKEYYFYDGLVRSQLALQGQGDSKVALDALLNFAKADPQSFHYYSTADALGTLSAAAGAHDKASQYFTALSAAPFPEYKMKAQYMLGAANLAVGKVTEARAAFAAAIALTADGTEAKRFQKLARVGVVRCDTADKKADEAIKNLRTMISESDATDSQLFSQLYNALGEAHRQSGQDEEALLAYLHTDLLFTSDSGSHAEALYYLSQLFSKVDPQRAADAKARLQSQYASSAWAKK